MYATAWCFIKNLPYLVTKETTIHKYPWKRLGNLDEAPKEFPISDKRKFKWENSTDMQIDELVGNEGSVL